MTNMEGAGQAELKSFMKSFMKSFDEPDEVRPYKDHGEARIVNVGGGTVGQGIFKPGWRWSEDVKPIAGTDSCEVAHFGYIASGRMTVRMDSGEEFDAAAGSVVVIPPGHDAWVDDEECIFIDFAGADNYAKAS